MAEKKEITNKNIVSEIKVGDTVKVYQKVTVLSEVEVKGKATKGKGKPKKESAKVQMFEGLVIARKHGQEAGATITVRRVASGVGVEKIFPLNSPTIEKIEIAKRAKVRRAKLYYLRNVSGKRARLKRKSLLIPDVIQSDEAIEENTEEIAPETVAESAEEKAV